MEANLGYYSDVFPPTTLANKSCTWTVESAACPPGAVLMKREGGKVLRVAEWTLKADKCKLWFKPGVTMGVDTVDALFTGSDNLRNYRDYPVDGVCRKSDIVRLATAEDLRQSHVTSYKAFAKEFAHANIQYGMCPS